MSIVEANAEGFVVEFQVAGVDVDRSRTLQSREPQGFGKAEVNPSSSTTTFSN